jgi:LysR family glycine cleavage system transcriptional activator
MLPSLENLRCFAEAARLLNFRGAARAVALTPAAFGQRIQKLEEEIGQALFVRTTRRVTLTQAGMTLLPYARRALEAAADCVRAGRGQVAPVPMDLTIGTRHELGMSWIFPLLPSLRAAYPGLTVHLYFGYLDLVQRVRTAELDCCVGSMRITDPKLDSLRLHGEDYVFVGSPTLLERQPLRTEAHAAAHTLVDDHAALPLFKYWRDAPGGGDRLRFRHIILMGTIAAMRALVLAGEGVAVLPLYVVADDLRAGRLRRIFPSVALLSDHFRLIFRSDDPRRSVYEAMATQMRAVPLS